MPQKDANKQISDKQYYFDSTYLRKYIDQRVKLKVYVEERYLSVADLDDLENELYGVGYDNNGEARMFQYRDIEQVKAGSKIITLDQLQQLQTPEEPEEPAEEEPTEPEGDDLASEEEPPADSKKPTPPTGEGEPAPEEEEEIETAGYDPFMIGRTLIRESAARKSENANRMVRILQSPYYNVTGIVTEEFDHDYEIRCLSAYVGRVIISKDKVRFL